MADQSSQVEQWDTVPEYVRTGEESGVETLDSEVTIIQDLSEAENPQIECVLPEPSANATEPLISDDDTPSASLSMVVPAVVESDKKEATPKLNPRRSFTTEFKLECVLHAEKTQNKTKTAREFNVNRRRVQEWCTQKEKLMAIPKQQKRLSGVNRRQSGCDLLKDEKPAESDTPSAKVDSELASMTCAPQEQVSVIGPDKATGCNAPEVLTVQSIDRMTSDTVIDSLVRGLPLDLSLLPPNMIRVLQDLSAEVLSHEARASIESMIRETSMEMLIQKGSDNTRQATDAGEGESDSNCRGPQATGPSAQQDSAGDQPDASANGGDGDPADDKMDSSDTQQEQEQQQQQVSEDTPLTNAAHTVPMRGPPVDTTIQAAILEALMQVASTVQASPTDLLQPANAIANLQGAVTELPSQITAGENLQVVPAAEESVVAMESEDVKENNNIVVSNKVPSLQQQQQQQGLSMSNTPGRGISVSLGGISSVQNAAAVLPALRTRVKKFYTVDFKIGCITYAESASKCAAARKFHVDRRRVQDWCSQKEKLLQLKSISDGDKKPAETELIEKQLAAWVKEQLEGGKSLTRKMVGDEAVQLFRESGNTLFNAGTGWVAKFMIRNNISLVGSSSSKQAADILPEIVEIDGSGNT